MKVTMNTVIKNKTVRKILEEIDHRTYDYIPLTVPKQDGTTLACDCVRLGDDIVENNWASLYHLAWIDGHSRGEGWVFRAGLLNLKTGKRI